MASTGRGMRRNELFPIEGFFRNATAPDVMASIANDWLFGSSVWPVPVEIPYAWLSPPIAWRPENPINAAQVTPSDGRPARRSNETSIDTYGEYARNVGLSTQITADAPALAAHLVTYYSAPRMRLPSLAINLMQDALTTSDRCRILRLEIGDQIRITGSETAGWPDGASLQVVEGIRHAIGANVRMVTLLTSPVVGTAAGASGPWFRPGESALGGSHALPF